MFLAAVRDTSRRSLSLRSRERRGMTQKTPGLDYLLLLSGGRVFLCPSPSPTMGGAPAPRWGDTDSMGLTSTL